MGLKGTGFLPRRCEIARKYALSSEYHSEYLASRIDKLCEDLGGEELWTVKELGIPVYNTEDSMLFLDIRDPLADLLLGMDIRKTTSVTCFL